MRYMNAFKFDGENANFIIEFVAHTKHHVSLYTKFSLQF